MCRCCGCGNNYYIVYDEGNNSYCYNCAFGYGAIDEDQHRGDQAENWIMEELIKQRNDK